MQLCSSLMAACLNTACLCVRLKFRLAHCHFMTGHALTLVVAVGKQCVYRRQLWKVAMLTWEEVYFSFHNFLHFYFGNDDGHSTVFRWVQNHSLFESVVCWQRMFVLASNLMNWCYCGNNRRDQLSKTPKFSQLQNSQIWLAINYSDFSTNRTVYIGRYASRWGTLDFKWEGWLNNGLKNPFTFQQNPKKSLDLKLILLLLKV